MVCSSKSRSRGGAGRALAGGGGATGGPAVELPMAGPP